MTTVRGGERARCLLGRADRQIHLIRRSRAFLLRFVYEEAANRVRNRAVGITVAFRSIKKTGATIDLRLLFEGRKEVPIFSW